MDFFDKIFDDLFDFGEVKEIIYPCFWIDEFQQLHYPCTVQINKKRGELFYYYFYGQVYPRSIYTHFGKPLPFSTGE